MAIKDVLIVDDDALFCWALRKGLECQGLNTRIAGTGMQCLEALAAKRFDLVFLDIRLPDATGLDLLEAVLELSPGTRVVIVSGDGSFENRQKALSEGAEQFIEKPFDIGVLTRFVAGAMREEESRRRHSRYLCRFPLKLSVLSPLPGEEQFFLGCMDGVAEDIGREGLRLTTDYPLREGQEVRLRIAPRTDPLSSMVPGCGFAEVVWSDARIDASTAGLRFLPDRTLAP